MTGAALDGDPFLHLTAQSESFLKKQRLKGQGGLGHQPSEVAPGEGHIGLPVVHPGQLQQALHQPAHLLGHGENALGELGLGLGLVVGALKQLGVGHDDGQGGLQLVGRVGDKLPLLLPSTVHRPHRPAGQQQADDQEKPKADHADEHTGAQQIVQSGQFAGHVGEHDALGGWSVDPAKAKTVVL